MPLISDAGGLLRFVAGARRFLREPLSVEAAKAGVLDRMSRRDEHFLRLLERTVFQQPRSPYRQLFRAAGCEYADLERVVRKEGLEAALEQVREAGVYVTYAEFKGREPAVRGGQSFSFQHSDFDNPLPRRGYWGSSGGTRGRPSRVPMSLEHIEQSAPHWALWFAAHGWMGQPVVFWTPVYAAVVNRQLMCAKFGSRFARWFASGYGESRWDRLASACFHRLVRRAAGFSKPEPCLPGQEAKLRDALRALLEPANGVCVVTSPSCAVRLSGAVQEAGERLPGVSFLLGAEPLTPERKRAIEACGARAVPTYGFSEGGSVGSQCPQAGEADDVHVSLDAFAVIQRGPQEENGGAARPIFLTSLRPACPKILLNTAIGDSAVVERRRCGCLFDEMGYVQHVHTIRSSQKLTAEGVTILAGDLYPLLEKVLPRRFGGGAGDYQLVEEQNGAGLTRYGLLVGPRVGPVDEESLIRDFFEELGNLQDQYRVMARIWAQANVVQVRRESPVATARGKVLPFQARSTEPAP